MSNNLKAIFFLNSKGQSLLEIAVSLGLITIIITVLTITTINGLKNSQFAKNQVLASSYAQQGIELVKAMRQRDCQIILSNSTVYRWFDNTGTPKLVWSTEAANEAAFAVNNSATFTANNSLCRLQQAASAEVLEEGAFLRTTKLERIDTGVMQVTVIVTWNDFSGSHQAKNVSLLTNY